MKCAKPREALGVYRAVPIVGREWGVGQDLDQVGARSEVLPAWHHPLELSPKAANAVLRKRGFGHVRSRSGGKEGRSNSVVR